MYWDTFALIIFCYNSDTGLNFTKYVYPYFDDFCMEKSNSYIPILDTSTSSPHLHFSGLAGTEASKPAKGHAWWNPVMEVVCLHISKTVDKVD